MKRTPLFAALSACLVLPALSLVAPSPASAKPPARTVMVDSCISGATSFVEWSGAPTGSVVLEYRGPAVAGGRGHEKRLSVESELVVVSPTASDGWVEVVTPDGVGAGWELAKAQLYASSDGRGKHVTKKIGLPCEDGPPCLEAPTKQAPVATVSYVNHDTYHTYTAIDGGWMNPEECSLTFSYEWVDGNLLPALDVIGTGSPIDLPASVSYCNVRVLVTATNEAGSTVALSDNYLCG